MPGRPSLGGPRPGQIRGPSASDAHYAHVILGGASPDFSPPTNRPGACALAARDPARRSDRRRPEPARYPESVSLIATSGLTKRYAGGITALDGLTVEIEPGIIGLVGSNGAGKSTLLKILLGLLEPTAGSATIFDLPVATRGIEIRELVGYMPEHDCLPPDMTATDIVSHLALISGLPRAAARERTAEVLRHVGLYEERYRAIGGYSTGMKQRVKLAQALVHDPRLLLLDEPTNGLDPAGRDEMLELILRTGKEFGIAVIVASHLLGEIERVCDHLVAIENGKLLRSAPLGSFTERTGTLAVEVEEGREALVERLTARGLRVAVDGPAILVDLVDEAPFDIVRDTVVELGLALVRMEQRRHRLEDLFRDQPAAVAVAAAATARPIDDGPTASAR
jgi:ABC-2 type transport system ATP-binding protein